MFESNDHIHVYSPGVVPDNPTQLARRFLRRYLKIVDDGQCCSSLGENMVILFVCLIVCLFVCFDSLRLSQQSLSYVGTVLPCVS